MKFIAVVVLLLFGLSFQAQAQTIYKVEAPLMVAYGKKGKPVYQAYFDGKYQTVTKAEFMGIVDSVVSTAKEVACTVKPDSVTVEVKGLIGLTWETAKWCADFKAKQ